MLQRPHFLPNVRPSGAAQAAQFVRIILVCRWGVARSAVAVGHPLCLVALFLLVSYMPLDNRGCINIGHVAILELHSPAKNRV